MLAAFLKRHYIENWVDMSSWFPYLLNHNMIFNLKKNCISAVTYSGDLQKNSNNLREDEKIEIFSL